MPQQGFGAAASAPQAMEAALGYALDALQQGVPPATVEESLRTQGLDAASASTVVQQAFQIREARRSAANRNMLVGGLWCVGGIIVTVVTYSAASEGGGTYMVAWGAIIFGAIQFFRGLSQTGSR